MIPEHSAMHTLGFALVTLVAGKYTFVKDTFVIIHRGTFDSISTKFMCVIMP